MTRARVAVAVALVTAGALALRLYVALDQSAFGDELFTYRIVVVPGFSDVVDGIQATESTPPVFYTLAWLSQKLGDPVFFQRLPSVLASTATVPLIYLLGARTVGRGAALLAAAAFAVSPFVVFFGSEARAYAVLTFFEVAAAVALLRALDRGASRWWWAAFWLAGSGVVLTHYTGVPALAALGVWALWMHPERLRALVGAYVAIGLSLVAWLPFAEKNVATAIVDAFYPATLENIVAAPLRALYGYPVPVGLDTVPGIVPLVVLLVITGVGAVTFARRFARARDDRGALALLPLLALSTPLALLLWSVVGADLFAPRNVQASLPAALLLIAGGVVTLPRRAAIATAAAWLVALAIGTGVALQPEQQRIDFAAAAEFVESRQRPGDAIVEVEAFPGGGPLLQSLEVNFDRPHRVLQADLDQDAIRAAGRTARRVFVVMPERQLGDVPTRVPPELAGRREVERRRYPGQADLFVVVLE